MKKLVVLLCLAMAANAFAVVDPDDDHVGVYYDLTADTVDSAVTNGMAYLILTNCTSPGGVRGFECTVSLGAGFLLGAVVNAGDAVDADNDMGGFAVGIGTAIPPSDAILLVTFTYFAMGPDCWYLGPPAVESIPGHMAYADGDDVGLLKPMYPSSGDFLLPVASVLMGCEVVSNVETSWGGVKNLYR